MIRPSGEIEYPASDFLREKARKLSFPDRCVSGVGDPQNMECMSCGAAYGEVCRKGKDI